jgi:ABC-type multidrug transport system fused ATPase/permease subunit
LLNRSQDSIAARLRKEVFESLLTKRELEWFQQVSRDDVKDDKNKEVEKNDDDFGGKTKKKTKHDKSKQNRTTTAANSSFSSAAIGVILKDDVDTVANTVTNTLANLLRSSSSVIFGTYNMLCINPQLVGLSVAVAPVVGTLAFMTRKYLKKIVTKQQQAAIQSASFVEERLNHIAMVKTSNRELDEVEKYNQIQDDCVELGQKASLASGLSMGIMFGLSSTAFCGILLAGRRAVKAQKMTTGQLTSFGTYSFMLALGTAGVVKALGEYSKGMQCAARLYNLIHAGAKDENQQIHSEQEEIKEDDRRPVDTDLVQKISIENVTFSYKADPSNVILKDLSFNLSRGEVVALVGSNGSGKSTIASLLAGMYRPQSGEISLYPNSTADDTPQPLSYARDVNRKDQVHLVQVVPQVPALFNMTILDNIRYSRSDASEEDVITAMKSANCTFVSTLDDGLDYQVGRNGIRLSGGQRQRIGLARAFLADPVFLVLDEPTSAMDVEGETALKDTMKACRSSNRGLLVITHKAKTLEYCDRILVLNDGKLVQEGTMEDLQKDKDGEFVALMSDLE